MLTSRPVDLQTCVNEMSRFWYSLPMPLQDELQGVRLVAFPTAWSVDLRGVGRLRPDQRGLFVGQQRKLVSENDLHDLDSYAAIDWDEDAPMPRQPARGTIAVVAQNMLDLQMLEHTILHEIGHALGMSEAELHEEMGL